MANRITATTAKTSAARLQLFLEKVRPTPMPWRRAGRGPQARRRRWLTPRPAGSGPSVGNGATNVLPARRRQPEPVFVGFRFVQPDPGQFQLSQDDLVRDYAKLIETDMASTPLTPCSRSNETARRSAAALAGVERPAPHHFVRCHAGFGDCRARTGASYIIQGPPARENPDDHEPDADYVARGKRVLFVCEKRAPLTLSSIVCASRTR